MPASLSAVLKLARSPFVAARSSAPSKEPKPGILAMMPASRCCWNFASIIASTSPSAEIDFLDAARSPAAMYTITDGAIGSLDEDSRRTVIAIRQR